MAEPTDKEIATLFIAALLFVFDHEKPSEAFDAAKEFVAEFEKQIPGLFNGD
jgi:hypothetical protein